VGARGRREPRVGPRCVGEHAQARARTTPDAAIVYEIADLEALDLPAGAFDLAYSSLALHYIENLGSSIAAVHRALKPGCRFVFSIEHPVYTAPRKPGWSTRTDGQKIWPVESYAVERLRTTDWLTQGVRKYHRTFGTLMNLLTGAGFAIDRVEDFCPTDAQIAARSELGQERERPIFLLVAATRR
jgi:SAM-dependent methyltransferase